MTDITSSFNDIQKIIDILIVIKNKINDQTEMIYTFWQTPQEAIDEMDICIHKLQIGDTEILTTINMLFIATGPFQELSMQNGWSKEYLKIAAQFDKAYGNLKHDNQ